MNGRTLAQAFVEWIPKSTAKEEKPTTKKPGQKHAA
jgi:hypothetical protein